MSTTIKVACVGGGFFSQFHFDAWQRIPETSLCGVCDIDHARAAATGHPAYTDLGRMLTEISPDILDVITPPATHVEIIEQAIDLGVRVIICQKAFCRNLAEAVSVAETAANAGITLIVHENFRFQPWFRAVRQQLDEQALGQVQQALFRLRTGDGQGPNAYMDRQPYFQKMQQLLIHETGVHYIDTFCYLFGEPTAVYADLRRLNPAIAGEDAGLVIFDFPEQLKAVLDGNRHLDFEAVNTRVTFGVFIVEGTEACLKLYGDGRLTQRQFGSQQERTLLEPTKSPGFAGDCVYALSRHVVDHMLNGAEVENTAQQYLQILRLEQLVYDSAARGCKLSVLAETV
ncbi:MAG: Gfo/Idh/MocA family protein [Granulosicoccus sp.]